MTEKSNGQAPARPPRRAFAVRARSAGVLALALVHGTLASWAPLNAQVVEGAAVREIGAPGARAFGASAGLPGASASLVEVSAIAGVLSVGPARIQPAPPGSPAQPSALAPGSAGSSPISIASNLAAPGSFSRPAAFGPRRSRGSRAPVHPEESAGASRAGATRVFAPRQAASIASPDRTARPPSLDRAERGIQESGVSASDGRAAAETAGLGTEIFDGARPLRRAVKGTDDEGSAGAAQSAPRARSASVALEPPSDPGVRPGGIVDRNPFLAPPATRGLAAQGRDPALQGRDEFGGPRSLYPPLWKQAAGRLGDVTYGLKWGIHMLGMLAALNFAAMGVRLALQLFLGGGGGPHIVGGGDSTLEQQFGQVLSQAPWRFLFYEMPWQMLREEAEFRFAIFGGLFLGLASLKPAFAALGRLVAGRAGPEPAGARARARLGGLVGRLGGVSRFAFPIAAVASGLYFAARHFALWGADPVGIIARTGFAVAMAWVFYKTRSLVAPITAHWLYDALQFFGAILIFHFGVAPIVSSAYLMFLSMGSLAFLWYHVRAALKARAAARAGESLQ